MIKEKTKREKRINSKRKGNAFELKIVNLFKKAWGVTAYRTPGSGAYTSRAVSAALKEAAVGDIVIEELPEIVLECKNYYSLSMTEWFKEKIKEGSILGFWRKLEKEAKAFKKIPLLICKENNSPIVVISTLDFANIIKDYTGKFNEFFSMTKNGLHLVVFSINELLMLDLKQIRVIIEDMGKDKLHRTYAINTKKRRFIL